MKNMIASQKKGNVEMGLNYHNLMEDIVLQHVDRILEADGCCCDICKSDVIAYALNHLPPQYVVTDTGRMMVKLKNCDSQNRTDVLAALSNAVKLIRDNPRRYPPPVGAGPPQERFFDKLRPPAILAGGLRRSQLFRLIDLACRLKISLHSWSSCPGRRS